MRKKHEARRVEPCSCDQWRMPSRIRKHDGNRWATGILQVNGTHRSSNRGVLFCGGSEGLGWRRKGYQPNQCVPVAVETHGKARSCNRKGENGLSCGDCRADG